MQSDLCDDTGDKEYKNKVAQCFELRCTQMQKRELNENKKWENAINLEKNYIMYKKGYKHMLDDIVQAKINLSKFKRGLSIYEDPKLSQQLTSKTAAPVLEDYELKGHLQKVLLS